MPMNINQVKNASWLLAGLLGAGLCGYVYLAWLTLAEDKGWDREQALKLLENEIKDPPPQRDELVSYDQIKRTFHALNWTGKEPPKVEKGPDADKPVKPPDKPVAELLKVLYIQVDTTDAANSLTLVVYKDPALAKPGKKNHEAKLRPEGRLPEPYQYVRVARIEEEQVVFAFDDDKRPEEQVSPAEFESKHGIVQVGPGGAVLPKAGSRIPINRTATSYRPKQITLFGPNSFIVGTDDMEILSKTWSQEISENLRHVQHKDPATGKFDGIELKDVKPGSYAAKFGAQNGDVVKSINGHPVNSVQEAISFAKTHDEQYDTWEIVVESMGKTKTVTIKEPAK